MKKNVLILTDHTNHSSQNSLYDLAVKMLAHDQSDKVDVATRAIIENNDFFNCSPSAKLYATTITERFSYNKEQHPLNANFKEVDLESYNLVWLRMPPPLGEKFLKYISDAFSKQVIINDPKAITKTGSKEFLINFPSVCPPLKICNSLEDINEFRQLFPVVLKPFRAYGGQGIVKIDGDKVSSGNQELTFATFSASYLENPIKYLAVKFLKNVSKGDKRIVVVNGEIMGASLRLPAENSWLCNVAMGGTSNRAEVDADEKEIVQLINPILTELGIVMYGVDTLVNDSGKRILSEINTTSIGGLPQIAAIEKQPLVEKAIDLIWDYYNEKTKNNG